MTKTYDRPQTFSLTRWALTLCLIALLPLNSYAQIEFDDDNDDEDEITVVDELGNEEEIDFPEAMDSYLDSLMTLYMTRTYLTVDNDCQMRDENPTYSREQYIDRLYRMPTVMEMPWNEVVQTCIDRYTNRLRRQVSFMLGAANFYMPIFEEALEAYHLPLELKYLPVIESALNPVAVSRVGATGLWQFMITTGKAYGLEVNSLLDERRDPVKSSWAAAHYLSDLYKIFGDWNLVIAAYNCGPENINKAIRRAGGETDYWKIYPFLPKETRGYVPAFIAANYVMTYYCEHNICPMSTQLPAKSDTVVVTQNVSLDKVAAVSSINAEMLKALNPQYRHDIVPGATAPYPIRLPIADVARFIDMQDSIYAASSEVQKRTEIAIDEHVVKPSSKNTKSRKGRKSNRSGGSKQVTVRKGDTLGAIAKRNGTTVAKLKSLNGIRGNNIQAGKKLRVR